MNMKMIFTTPKEEFYDVVDDDYDIIYYKFNITKSRNHRRNIQTRVYNRCNIYVTS